MTDTTKTELRRTLRAARRAHVEALPDSIRGLLFHRPPAPLLARIGDEAVIGLYHAGPWEAPAGGYARFFHEAGHTLALPRFASRTAPMAFAHHTDPYADSDLEVGPFGMLQPGAEAQALVPDVLFVPLVGFTASGERLGQGAGHYDRWLAEHPPQLAVGLAWDAQACETLPTEPHDIALDAIVTPTRIYGHL
ncbi:5-formyltetrahydrofolate cyclo-ligase [Erythrobacter sp. BLCC-B19]|uniref:5-formyltetrahydrofolate cyclo-ligase n=1 Tax=Erythrobacter sp. BLCC-B19 TaxID=3025315 RepID=UPI002363158F|nr:5-formyltetrahydrofolate cyclo-ligase [Erythrobacter sp. BLCC-B19]WDA40821.1 5-formyltetrahydrofolate cyclo-ligase [Erythrobacter sp. BLCC-B19]